MTKQRKIVLDIIKNSLEHLNAYEVFLEARKQMGSISQGTVYRNLGVLCDLKLIKRIQTPQGIDVYDKTCNPHGHIVCPTCGSIKDYDSMKITEILNKDFNNELESYDLTIKVICKKCKQKRRKLKCQNTQEQELKKI